MKDKKPAEPLVDHPQKEKGAKTEKSSFFELFIDHWKLISPMFLICIGLGIVIALLIMGARPASIELDGVKLYFPTQAVQLTPLPTDTPSLTPTLTSPSVTPSITPTATSTSIPLSGEDFSRGCIYQANWNSKPYSTFQIDRRGCLKMEGWGMTSGLFNNNGTLSSTPSSDQLGLMIDSINTVSEESIHGIYTLLPGSEKTTFQVSFDIAVIDMTRVAIYPNPAVGFGLGLPDKIPDVGSFLLYQTFPGDPNIYFLTSKSISGKIYCYTSNLPDCVYYHPQHVIFKVDGFWLTIQANGILLETDQLPKRDGLVFWIGYRLPPKSSAKLFIWDLEIY